MMKNSCKKTASGEINLSDPTWYLNRELTWLEFNSRVLHEAEDERTPLLERLKFIAIVSSNLDEFFMKRIGGLKQLVGAGLREVSLDGRTPSQQIQECRNVIRLLESRKYALLQQILELLKEQGIRISRVKDLATRVRKNLRNHFATNVYPLLTPQSIDPAHPFPFISNLSLNLLLTKIVRETQLHREHGGGLIQFKINALEDGQSRESPVI